MTAAEYQFDPREYVDREWHQEQLRQMILRQIDHRALLISDVSGQGKSDLLLRLRLNCLENNPRASVLLVDIRDLATPFSAIERAYRNDQNDDTFGDHLQQFCRVYETWSSTATLNLTGQGGRTEILVEASNAQVGAGASVIGLEITATPAGTAGRESQRQILRALTEDLRAARPQPLVILVDHYNRAEQAVRNWVNERLLQPCLADELSDVVVVIASTPGVDPSYAEKFEQFLRRGELARLEEDQARVAGVLRAHRLLSDDSPDYILSMAVDQLAKGRKVAEMISIVRLVVSEGDHGH